MAYKFQLGEFTASGSITVEGDGSTQEGMTLKDDKQFAFGDSMESAIWYDESGQVTGDAANSALVISGSHNAGQGKYSAIQLVGRGSSYSLMSNTDAGSTREYLRVNDHQDGKLQLGLGMAIEQTGAYTVAAGGMSTMYHLTASRGMNISVGSAEAPSALSFGDGDTYLYESADDVLKLFVANAEEIEINSSGSVHQGHIHIHGQLRMPDNTSAKILVADGTSFQEVAISGDVTIASNGAVTIGTGVVEHAMLDGDCVDGDNIADDAINSEHIFDGAVDNVHLANSAVTITAGDGLKTGGSVSLGGTVTLDVDVSDFAGTGLDADGSENINVAAAQTTITSIYNTGLKVGRGASDEYIDFGTDNQVKLACNNVVGLTLTGEGSSKTNAQFSGNLIVSGDLMVSGSTSEIEVEVLKVDNPYIESGLVDGEAPGSDLGKDLGLVMHYYDGSAKKAAFMYDESATKFNLLTDATVGDSTTGTKGVLVANLEGDVTGNADSANLATTITISANNSANETVYPVFVDGATGTQGLESDTGLSYNPSTGRLTAVSFAGQVVVDMGADETITSGELTSANDAASAVALGLGYNILNFDLGNNTKYMKLPTMAAGDTIEIKLQDISGTGALVIAAGNDSSGVTIDGGHSIFLESPYAAVKLVALTAADIRVF